MAGAAVAVLAGAAWYGWDYWTVGQYLVSTDDAYVKADNTTVAPKISGYLHEVLVGDNERVKAGQVLARIDQRDFRVALDQAKADVAAARAAIASRQAQLQVQQAVIDAANSFGGTVGRLLVLQENYPQLKSNENFLKAQDEVVGTENRIATARKDYNEAIQDYNTTRARFPTVISAKLFGFKEEPYFKAEDTATQVPRIDSNSLRPNTNK
jgi:multidrug resistance efflux pump